MANRLSMAQINSIEQLHRSGHANREIARLLGIHRETVNRYVRELKRLEDVQNRPNAPTGSEAIGSGPASGPKSRCDPYREQILAKLELGLSATRIHQLVRNRITKSGEEPLESPNHIHARLYSS
ncbi:MAG: helix-turn-helix domain-containing protein, partial [Planctomycetales bacterium]|nr:helix-turn-helix domain-containing protein [Planctomycetales bacterium]